MSFTRRCLLAVVLLALALGADAQTTPLPVGFAGGTIAAALKFSPDNTVDIGGSHTTLRPRNIFAGTLIDSPKLTTTGTGTNSGLTLASAEAVGVGNNGNLVFGPDTTGAFIFSRVNGLANTSGSQADLTAAVTINPASGTASFAVAHLNPTIVGATTGTVYGLGVASVTNQLSAGKIKSLSIGTTTTDLFTGYTETFAVATTGVVNLRAVIATQSVAPTCISGCGATPTVTGSDSGGRITTGTSPSSVFVLVFNGTYPGTNPSCQAQAAQSTTATVAFTNSTATGVTINTVTAPGNNTIYNYWCAGLSGL